jgi:hypothetical protein
MIKPANSFSDLFMWQKSHQPGLLTYRFNGVFPLKHVDNSGLKEKFEV